MLSSVEQAFLGRDEKRVPLKTLAWEASVRAAHFSCTFLCRCFARLQRETSRNFLVTRFMEEMSYVFSFTFFFTAAHFHLALVAASISHFVRCRYKIFMLFFRENVSFGFYLPL